MSELIVVNGPPGIGTAPVIAVLRAAWPAAVAISGDMLRGFAPLDARAHLGGGATYRVAGTLAKAYAELGAERVVFDYVFSRATHFRYFSESLPASARLTVFTLWADLETVRARDHARPEHQRVGRGSNDVYQEMQLNLSAMGHIVPYETGDPALAAARIIELAG